MAMYEPIKKVAEISGFSEREIRNWSSRTIDPLPHVMIGNKKMIKVSEVEAFADRMIVGNLAGNRDKKVIEYVKEIHPEIYVEALNALGI